MNEQEKIQFLEQAILELFKIDSKLNTTDKLIDVGLDSLDIVELQMYYEDKVKKEIPDNVNPIVTVADLVELM